MIIRIIALLVVLIVIIIFGITYTIKQAQKLAYEGVELIDWDDGFYRKDIGWRAI